MAYVAIIGLSWYRGVRDTSVVLALRNDDTKLTFSILLRLHRSLKVSIGLDEASCPEAGGSRPGCTSALSAQRGSNPGKKIMAQNLLSTQDV